MKFIPIEFLSSICWIFFVDDAVFVGIVVAAVVAVIIIGVVFVFGARGGGVGVAFV